MSAAEDLSTKHSMVQVHLPSMPEMIRRQVIEHEGALGWQMGCKLLAENIRAAATVAIVSVSMRGFMLVLEVSLGRSSSYPSTGSISPRPSPLAPLPPPLSLLGFFSSSFSFFTRH